MQQDDLDIGLYDIVDKIRVLPVSLGFAYVSHQLSLGREEGEPLPGNTSAGDAMGQNQTGVNNDNGGRPTMSRYRTRD